MEEQGADPAGAAGEGPAGQGGQRLGRQGQVHLRAPRQVQRIHAEQDRLQAQEGYLVLKVCMSCMCVCFLWEGNSTSSSLCMYVCMYVWQ